MESQQIKQIYLKKPISEEVYNSQMLETSLMKAKLQHRNYITLINKNSLEGALGRNILSQIILPIITR